MPLVRVLGRQPLFCARSMLVGANNGAVEQQLQVVILEVFVHTAQAISFPRLTFYTITKQEILTSSTCSVLPRDLVSVEVAAEQAGALPQTLLTRSTFPVLYPVLAPERGPRWQTHTQRRNLRISVRPGQRAPAATLPAIPAAGESATPSKDRSRRWHSTANSAPRQSQWRWARNTCSSIR